MKNLDDVKVVFFFYFYFKCKLEEEEEECDSGIFQKNGEDKFSAMSRLFDGNRFFFLNFFLMPGLGPWRTSGSH